MVMGSNGWGWLGSFAGRLVVDKLGAISDEEKIWMDLKYMAPAGEWISIRVWADVVEKVPRVAIAGVDVKGPFRVELEGGMSLILRLLKGFRAEIYDERGRLIAVRGSEEAGEMAVAISHDGGRAVVFAMGLGEG